ncbi:MAG: DUF952 domain-containing protein [Candidatus Promineifilaceae bacterium]|nr:DUF952 domain-containing protein [Candidatus Promineifilaceae bacterium]
MILHITTRDRWETAASTGFYYDHSLHIEGFIHCSTPQQIISSANKHYLGQSGLVLLSIATEKVTAPIKYEDSYESGQAFPHIYGLLNTDAVMSVVSFPTNEDGTFNLPADFETLPDIQVGIESENE